MLKILLALCILSSCAHGTKKNRPEIAHEIHQKNVSTQAVLDLAKTSYIRGCTEATVKNDYAKCLERAKKHIKELEKILE